MKRIKNMGSPTKNKRPAKAGTKAGQKVVLKQSLRFGYGIFSSSASPRRRKWTVDACLCVEVLE